MPCHRADIACSPVLLNILNHNLDENMRGIFIKFKDNKMLNGVEIDQILGELI